MEKSYFYASNECIKHPSCARLPWLTEEGIADTGIAVLGELDTVASQPGCYVSAAFIPELPGCNDLRASQPALTPTHTSLFGLLQFRTLKACTVLCVGSV